MDKSIFGIIYNRTFFRGFNYTVVVCEENLFELWGGDN